MRYAELKERVNAARGEEARMFEMGQREWLCPDGRMMISVSIRPYGDDPNIAMSVHMLREQQGGSVTIAGKEIADRYIDYVHDPLRSCSAQQLDYLVRARNMCERYVEGYIDELPLTIF